MVRPIPLIPRQRRYEVPERVAADGSVLTALDENSVRRLADMLAGDGGGSIADVDDMKRVPVSPQVVLTVSRCVTRLARSASRS